MQTKEETAEKVRENRLRRMAQRQGLQLVKSKRRDCRALDYSGWMVINNATNHVEYGGQGYINIDQVEQFLKGDQS